MKPRVKAEIITEREQQKMNKTTISNLQAMDTAQGTKHNMGQKGLLAAPKSPSATAAVTVAPHGEKQSGVSTGVYLTAAAVGGVAIAIGAVATAASKKT